MPSKTLNVTRTVRESRGAEPQEVTEKVVWDEPDTLDEAIGTYGEAVVLSLFNRAAEADVADEIHYRMQGGPSGAYRLTGEALQAHIDNYTPGTDREAARKAERVKRAITEAGLSKEEAATLLSSLP